MAATTTRRMTAVELEAVPEAERGELIRGEMQPVSPTSLAHFLLTGRLIRSLGNYAAEHDLGEVGTEAGFKLDVGHDTVLAPDVAFLRYEQVPPKGQRDGFHRIVPSLVAEILSPSNSASEMNEKVRIYLAAGVRLVWIVDPVAEVVTVYEPDGTARLVRPGEALDGGDVLPGFALALDDLFA